MYFQRYGSIKPGVGLQMDLEHPFAQDLLFAVLFNDFIFPSTAVGGSPILFQGSVNVGSKPSALSYNLSVAQPWVINLEGTAIRLGGSLFLRVSTDLGLAAGWIPSANVTITCIRRKVDTINRTAALFGTSGASGGYCHAYVPWSDGIAYWDFGGSSGTNRLSVSGLSFSITIPERWIFTAGTRGSTIWQNGIKVANQSTSVARIATADSFSLNTGPSAVGDEQEFNYFSFYNTQWADNLCQWWSASPYEHLYQPILRNYFFFGQSSQSTPSQPTNTRIQPIGNVSPTTRQYVRF